MRHLLLLTFAASLVSLATALSAVAAESEKPSVSALVKALSDKDEDVRWQAARSLGSMGSDAAAAVPALLKASQGDSSKVRAYAAFALGEIGGKSPEVADQLIKGAFDKSALVRRASVRALLKIDPPHDKVHPMALKILEQGDPAILIPAMHTLAEQGEAVVPRLCKVLDHDEACYWACAVLAEIGPKAKAAVPHLKKVLGHEDDEVRLEALVALGEIGPASKPLTPEIVAMLDKVDKKRGNAVRYAAAFALGKIGLDAAATKSLANASKSDDPFLCMVSVWALARNNPDDKAMMKRAVDLILQGLKSKDVHMRRAAAKIAVEFDVPFDDVAPMLIEALKDKDPAVVRNAVAALAELGPKALKRTDKLLKSKDLRYFAIALIVRLGPEAKQAVPALIEAMEEKSKDDADLEFQREVQFALAAIGPGASAAVPTLVKSLVSSNEQICASASFALGKIGPAAKGAVPSLRKNLKSGSDIVQLASVRALLEILPGEKRLGPVAIPLLLKGLKNEHELVRAECADGLGELGSYGKRALPQLKQCLKDESRFVRQAAAEAIKKLEK